MYCISILDANGCSIKSDTFRIENLTGIADAHDSFRLYPNPATSTLRIESDYPVQAELFNLNGEIISTSGKSETHVLKVNAFPRGCYFLRLSSSSGSIIQKVLLE
jgi:hypothetical protein